MREQVGKKTLTETVYRGSQYGDDWPTKLFSLIDFLTTRMGEVPVEWRETAEIEFNSDYDSGTVEIEITYRREESDQEFANRQFQEKVTAEYHQRVREKKERADYERLKAKFEPQIPQERA